MGKTYDSVEAMLDDTSPEFAHDFRKHQAFQALRKMENFSMTLSQVTTGYKQGIWRARSKFTNYAYSSFGETPEEAIKKLAILLEMTPLR